MSVLPYLALLTFTYFAFSGSDSASSQLEFERGTVQAQSSLDNLYYTVIDRKQKSVNERFANMLAEVRSKGWFLINNLRTKLRDGRVPSAFRDRVEALLKAYPTRESIKVAELDSSRYPSIAYNLNKGEAIYICLTKSKQSNASDTVGDPDTILFVLIHEIAHSMKQGYDPMHGGFTVHSDSFKEGEAFLMKEAAEMGLLRPNNIPGREHCGVVIPNPRVAT